jgi:hypothetical protein
MNTILNLTQHPATEEQIKQGVVDLPPKAREWLCKLLTFDTMPTSREVVSRAMKIAHMPEVAAHTGPCMIGGAPYLMPSLEGLLKIKTRRPVVYAFSTRESVEQVQPDGSVRKVAVFRHTGFVGL